MATASTLRFTPHDANVIAALAMFPGSPDERKKERLASLQAEEARLVGEVLAGVREKASTPPEVQATVNLYLAWVENNKRLRLNREARHRSNRGR